MTQQIHIGTVLTRQARRCWDLTAAVPAEYEAGLWAEGDRLLKDAATFGEEIAEREIARQEANRLAFLQLDLPHHEFW